MVHPTCSESSGEISDPRFLLPISSLCLEVLPILSGLAIGQSALYEAQSEGTLAKTYLHNVHNIPATVA